MDLIARVSRHFEENAHHSQMQSEMLAAPIAAAIEIMTAALVSGGKILACGNGPAAALAAYLATRLVGTFEAARQELAALALSGDGTLLTALGHDGVAVFSRQIRALGHAGDVLFIDTTGDDPRLEEAIAAAQEGGLSVIALTGPECGLHAHLHDSDIYLSVPVERAARVLEIHLLIIHCLCDGIDCLLLGVEE